MKAYIKGFIKYLVRRATGYGYYVDIGQVKDQLAKCLAGDNNILDQYGIKHGTDKASLALTLYDEAKMTHDYLRHYDLLFNSFRAEKFSLVEFGCYEGSSLRMWEEYFPNADIYGVDINEKTSRIDNTGGGGGDVFILLSVMQLQKARMTK